MEMCCSQPPWRNEVHQAHVTPYIRLRLHKRPQRYD